MQKVEAANRTEAVIHFISSWLNIAGSAVLSILVLVTATDVSMRYFFNHPLKGTYELTQLMMVAIAVLGLGYCASTKGHVVVDLIIDHFGRKSKLITEGIAYLLSIVVVAIIVLQSYLYALEALHHHETSDILKIPTFYFKLLIPIAFLVLALELIITMIQAFRKAASR